MVNTQSAQAGKTTQPTYGISIITFLLQEWRQKLRQLRDLFKVTDQGHLIISEP